MTIETYTEDDMLRMLHTDVDMATDVCSLAAHGMIKELEESVDDLLLLSREEKNMYIICQCFQHIYDNYYNIIDGVVRPMLEGETKQ